MKKQQIQIQIQRKTQMTAYEKKMVNNAFFSTMEWLEKYIEIAYKNEFPDWGKRKQISDNSIERRDIYEYPQRAETSLSSQLHIFADSLEDDATIEFREELKQEYYKWLDATGIDTNNCPERLKHFIFGLNEIFEGNYEKIRHDIANRKREVEMDSPEYMEKLSEMVALIQNPMKRGAELEKSLEGKDPDEVEVSRFDSGNNERGEQVFKGITNSVTDSYQSFYFKEQKGQQTNPRNWTNSEIIQDVRQNPRNWRLDEVITEYDGLGRATKKEKALIYYSAQVGFDGAVADDNQPVYLAQRFDQREIAQVNQALNVSQHQQQSTQVKQPPYKWNWK